MKIRHEKTKKATELSNTMQWKVDSELWKGGPVGIGRGEPAERWYLCAMVVGE